MVDITSFEDANKALHELRTVAESKFAETGEVKQKMAKIEASFGAFDIKNAELMSAIAAEKKEKDALIVRLDSLEKQLSRPNMGMVDEAKARKQAESKALINYLSLGKEKMQQEELKFLRTDIDADGGVFVSPEMSNEIVKKLTEVSPIRSLAKIRNIGSSSGLSYNKRTALISSYWVGEGEAITEGQSKYGQDTIKLEALAANVRTTIQMLQDSSISVEAEIALDVAEELAKKEGAAFVNGTGTSGSQPFGFMSNTSIGYTPTGSASAILSNSLITMTGEIKTGYRPVYGMNRKTLAAIRTLRTDSGAGAGTGSYMWQAGNLAGGLPNSLNGYGYIELPDMPDIAAGSFPVIFGDFAAGYQIIDRAGITVLRDPYTEANKLMVKLIFSKWTGGDVTLPEAFNKLKIATS
jgi:HK97 family phage major capsid protein